MFCLSCEVIISEALRALRVRDSNTIEDSAPEFNFVEEQDVLSILRSDH